MDFFSVRNDVERDVAQRQGRLVHEWIERERSRVHSPLKSPAILRPREQCIDGRLARLPEGRLDREPVERSIELRAKRKLCARQAQMARGACLNPERRISQQTQIACGVEILRIDLKAAYAQSPGGDRHVSPHALCLNRRSVEMDVAYAGQIEAAGVDPQKPRQKPRRMIARGHVRRANLDERVSCGHRAGLEGLYEKRPQLRLDDDVVHDHVHARMVQLEARDAQRSGQRAGDALDPDADAFKPGELLREQPDACFRVEQHHDAARSAQAGATAERR